MSWRSGLPCWAAFDLEFDRGGGLNAHVDGEAARITKAGVTPKSVLKTRLATACKRRHVALRRDHSDEMISAVSNEEGAFPADG